MATLYRGSISDNLECEKMNVLYIQTSFSGMLEWVIVSRQSQFVVDFNLSSIRY